MSQKTTVWLQTVRAAPLAFPPAPRPLPPLIPPRPVPLPRLDTPPVPSVRLSNGQFLIIYQNVSNHIRQLLKIFFLFSH